MRMMIIATEDLSKLTFEPVCCPEHVRIQPERGGAGPGEVVRIQPIGWRCANCLGNFYARPLAGDLHFQITLLQLRQ